jgi:hypothetical protein
MTITLNLPEDIARHLAARGEDPARVALEALALEGYRSRNLSEEQIRRMLGFDTRMDVHAFLKQHGVFLNYMTKDLQDDLGKPLRRHG